jgi:prepilin peptidase CpaA
MGGHQRHEADEDPEQIRAGNGSGLARPWLAGRAHLDAWFWGFAIMAIVLVALYLLYTTGTFGAGDAKYAAAMSGMFVGAPIGFLLALIASSMIGALLLHRVLRGIPASGG